MARMTTQSDVPSFMAMYPPADITPDEFEVFVVDLFSAVEPQVDDLRVTLNERVLGTDGSYDLDGSVRFRWGGLDFLVIIEAKHHRNPIK